MWSGRYLMPPSSASWQRSVGGEAGAVSQFAFDTGNRIRRGTATGRHTDIQPTPSVQQ